MVRAFAESAVSIARNRHLFWRDGSYFNSGAFDKVLTLIPREVAYLLAGTARHDEYLFAIGDDD